MANVVKNEKAPWNPPSTKSAREKMPSSAFLDPQNLKYPVKKQVNGKWVYSCKALRAAEVRAIQNGKTDIANKAKNLYQKLCQKG